jgi:N-carbamoylputrescine amidase|tara:strand:+ start:5933 stop:6760 length:828 start_codon:yes stop_codon:yes gene_type:complete
MDERILVALLTDVFLEDSDHLRLREYLLEAKSSGATLAVLPELPLNPWSPANRESIREDAEPLGGLRQQVFSRMSSEIGIALLGGAIVTDSKTGKRYNTALFYDHNGQLVGQYRKIHLPEEEGYWETSHYMPGTDPPTVIQISEATIGVQICSDINRPQGSQILRAQGAELLLVPRATPSETYERWRLILRANAIMSEVYLISVNRPFSEFGVDIGGPSLVVGPDGEILFEGTEPLAIVEIDGNKLKTIGAQYPGYLPRMVDVYARGWSELIDSE